MVYMTLQLVKILSSGLVLEILFLKKALKKYGIIVPQL